MASQQRPIDLLRIAPWQDRLLRGMRKRFQERSEVESRLDDQILQLQSKERKHLEASLQQMAEDHQRRTSQFLDRWDEQIDGSWREFEATIAGSLSDEKAGTRRIEKELNQAIKQGDQAHATQRANTVAQMNEEHRKIDERRALDAQVAIQKLQQVEAAYGEMVNAMARRSLSVTPLAPFQPSQYLKAASTGESVQQHTARMDEALASMKNLTQSLSRHPAAVWSESWRPWAFGVIVASIAGLLLHQQQWRPFLTAVTALGIGVLVPMLLLLGLRPWLSLLGKRVVPNASDMVESARVQCTGWMQTLENQAQADRQRLLEDTNRRIAEMDEQWRTQREHLQRDANLALSDLKHSESSRRLQSKMRWNQKLHSIDAEESPKWNRLEVDQKEGLRQVELQSLEQAGRKAEQLRGHQKAVDARWAQGLAATRELETQWQQAMAKSFPEWQDLGKESIPLGNHAAEEGVLPLGVCARPDWIPAGDAMGESSAWPLFLRFIEDGLLVVRSSQLDSALASKIVPNLMLRAWTTFPPGRFRALVIDPVGLGRDYAWLMRLADYDPALVSHRIWTQASHIHEQLQQLAYQTENIIQQSLRDRYPDLRAFNRDAGSLAEPYRLLVWAGFPAGLDEASWKSMQALLQSGPRCGIATVLLVDQSIPWPTWLSESLIQERGIQVRAERPVEPSPETPWTLKLENTPLRGQPLHVAAPPAPSSWNGWLDRVGEATLKGSRIEVPFRDLFDSSHHPQEASSAEGLQVAIGKSGVGRIQKLRLGVGTAQHALVAGKTGSGKSSLLHTLITSACIDYGPDQLRLVLLDFKKGVEFQVYAEANLPHADIIAMESEREFGVSALEYLDRLMQQRGEQFRSVGCQDVAGWRKARPDMPMPRVLLVIDEFQELFVEDDKLGQTASMYLDRIVRQGRSFGIHAILASQTLGGAYTLPRTTLAQMAVRVAMQCEGSDAMMILSEDNLAAERLRHPGQAIYNDAGGRVEGNQPFQVAWINKDQQLQRLREMPHQVLPSHAARCVVFNGHQPAKWSAETSGFPAGGMAGGKVELLIGESVAIEPALRLPISDSAGRNLLLVGSNDRMAGHCLSLWIASAVKSLPIASHDKLQLAIFDGQAGDSERGLGAKLAGLVPQMELADSRSAVPLLERLHQQLKDRISQGHGSWEPVLWCVSPLERFRDFRKSDDFSFGDSGTPAPDAVFQELLREGPAVGMHAIVWAQNASSIPRWLPRQSMQDFELRALMTMSAQDSNNLIDQPTAQKMNANVMLLYDDATGRITKFRPYELDSPEPLIRWALGSNREI
ncbi:MAG: FtsK/SpoIIIE domain-containing protein [Pirellulaceae bacterium]